LKDKARVGEDVKTYRVCEGEITLVEEVTGQFLIKNTDAGDLESEIEGVSTKDETDKDEEEGVDFKSSLKSRKAF
jgi:hypothetical protein